MLNNSSHRRRISKGEGGGKSQQDITNGSTRSLGCLISPSRRSCLSLQHRLLHISPTRPSRPTPPSNPSSRTISPLGDTGGGGCGCGMCSYSQQQGERAQGEPPTKLFLDRAEHPLRGRPCFFLLGRARATQAAVMEVHGERARAPCAPRYRINDGFRRGVVNKDCFFRPSGGAHPLPGPLNWRLGVTGRGAKFASPSTGRPRRERERSYQVSELVQDWGKVDAENSVFVSPSFSFSTIFSSISGSLSLSFCHPPPPPFFPFPISPSLPVARFGRRMYVCMYYTHNPCPCEPTRTLFLAVSVPRLSWAVCIRTRYVMSACTSYIRICTSYNVSMSCGRFSCSSTWAGPRRLASPSCTRTCIWIYNIHTPMQCPEHGPRVGDLQTPDG